MTHGLTHIVPRTSLVERRWKSITNIESMSVRRQPFCLFFLFFFRFLVDVCTCLKGVTRNKIISAHRVVILLSGSGHASSNMCSLSSSSLASKLEL